MRILTLTRRRVQILRARKRAITIHQSPGAMMLLRLSKFVRNGKNREILSWLGGGTVVIVAALWWSLFTHLHDELASAQLINGKILLGVHFADARTGWAVGEGGTIAATRDGGANWAPQHSGTDKYLQGVHLADARTGWAVGEGGTIVATRDGGANWAPQHSGIDKYLQGVILPTRAAVGRLVVAGRSW